MKAIQPPKVFVQSAMPWSLVVDQATKPPPPEPRTPGVTLSARVPKGVVIKDKAWRMLKHQELLKAVESGERFLPMLARKVGVSKTAAREYLNELESRRLITSTYGANNVRSYFPRSLPADEN